MTFSEWKREEGNLRTMTTMERLATNLATIFIARAAMIATPFVGFLMWYWLDSHFTELASSLSRVEDRVTDVESDGEGFKSKLQDHDSRIEAAKIRADTLEQQLKEHTTAIANSLESVKDRLSDLNGNVIALQTIISERVPKKEPQPFR
jgi:peptidoglycan hydrolase CwlO-like protein